MRKKISLLALGALLVLPAAGEAASHSLESKIEELSRQLAELKAQMEEINQEQTQQQEQIETIDQTVWNDVSTRFHWSGDFRSRYDYYSRDRYNTPATTVSEKNNSLVSNRLRLNMYAPIIENVEFAGRLAMFKAWGMQNTPSDQAGFFFGGYPAIDGNSGRLLSDNKLLVDRAIVNWNNVGGSNFWFSIGRRPTTDGPPSQLKSNQDQRMATPVSYMDWPFDGLTLGYAYDKLFNAFELPGRIRFCYGRGFEAGLGDSSNIDDTDFMGISWDIYNRNDRFVYFQSYVATDVFNYPDIADPLVGAALAGMMGPRNNIGDIYHTSALYMDKFKGLNYFLAGGWSRTDPNQNGMFNDFIAMQMGTAGPNTDSENGYSIYLGARYDFADSPFKVGLEYNYGSEHWIGMSPGHDDIYASKLATRGHTYEIYGIYDLPGRPLSRIGKAFIRVGYQHYRYDYTGSLDWNMRPYDLSSVAERTQAAAMGVMMVDQADQVYVTFEAKF